jgi:hypothetical protein
MSGIILSEHDCLAAIAQGLRTAEEAARMMAVHRPEVGFMWEKMAEAFGVNRMSINKLASEAASRTLAEKGPVRQ